MADERNSLGAATLQTFRRNAQLLRRKASKHAWIGMGIGVGAVLLASVVLAIIEDGSFALYDLYRVQKANPTLWILDLMPFAFAFWGQYVNVIMAYEAGALVLDQTSQLRAKNEALEREVQSSVTHDALTGLPNWLLLLDRLGQAIENARYDGRPLAVIRIGFARFKEVNDMLGYYNGDRVLKGIAKRIQGVIEKPDTLARSGGDDFVVILTRVGGREEAEQKALEIEEALGEAFPTDEVNVHVHPCQGMALFPDHGGEAETLLRKAYTAMSAAKKAGDGTVKYSPALEQPIS